MATARCEVIQSPSKGAAASIPLVLIHDGGGTTFQYYLLQSLGRPVFGITNPYFDSEDEDGPPEGVPELARCYVRALRSKIRRGRVILGGWSFGGMISLEMARILQGDRSLSVVGIVMLDSACPWSSLSPLSTLCKPRYRSSTQDRMKQKIDRSFEAAFKMIASWECPPPFTPPSTILLRAKETTVDLNQMLGWDRYVCLQFMMIMDVDGDHFSMFDDCKSETLTLRIKQACAFLTQ